MSPATTKPGSARPHGGLTVESLQLRLTRLKEVFKRQMRKYREAVYLLTGYKIELKPGSQSGHTTLRCRSMYAEEENDELRFQWNASAGGLELLESEWTKRLNAKIFAYLTTCHSVPAFLSNLTLDMFERQTFLPGAGAQAMAIHED